MSLSRKTFKPDNVTALAKLFSASVIQELSSDRAPTQFCSLIVASGLISRMRTGATVADVFELAFDTLKKRDYRHEYIYKAALTEKIQLGTHSLKSACMINEFRVGTSKADAVLFNGDATAYEIKSERDSLSRLKNQVQSYFEVFPFVNIIAGENHLPALEAMFPSDVGILILTRRYTIKTVREAVSNYDNLTSKSILDCIQLKEAKYVLELLGEDIPQVPNTRMYSEIENLFEKQNIKDLHRAMVISVKKNRSLEPIKEFINKVPTNLQNLAISAKLKKNNKLRFEKCLSTPIYSLL